MMFGSTNVGNYLTSFAQRHFGQADDFFGILLAMRQGFFYTVPKANGPVPNEM